MIIYLYIYIFRFIFMQRCQVPQLMRINEIMLIYIFLLKLEIHPSSIMGNNGNNQISIKVHFPTSYVSAEYKLS